MNIILPSGLSRFDTSSSRFDTGSSILIGQYAGKSLEEIGNVFIGNYAGEKAILVSDSVFMGMYAGQYIESANKSIIIGNDLSSKSINKDNILSIGFNNIEKETIGIGSNITSTGINNVIIGKDIDSYSTNSFVYGKDINIQSSYYFIDSLLYNDDTLLLDGYNKIGINDIILNTNILKSSKYYIKYHLNNTIKLPNTIFTNDTDIIFKFKPTGSFSFNLEFNIDTCNLINLRFSDSEILYVNRETKYDLSYSMLLTNENKFIYGEYNIIHIINNDKNYNALSLYINPKYNGYKVDKNNSKNYTNGLINSIKNLKTNNIILSYSLKENEINSNYIYDSIYNTITSNNINSNIDYSDYYAFNNSALYLSFKDFVISINDISINENYNIVYGKKLNIKGIKNICLGINHSIEGDNSIIIGNSINTHIKNSIILGNSNFNNNFNKSSVVLGNENFNNINYSSFEYEKFLSKKPVIIGNKINDIRYDVNICDIILRYSDEITSNELLLTGKNKYDTFLPMAIGYEDNTDVPIRGIYKFKYSSNIIWEYSNYVSNYIVNDIEYNINENIITSNIYFDVNINNSIILHDDKKALYVKNGAYIDTLSLYNNSNFYYTLKTDDKIRENTTYILPEILNNSNYENNTIYLSYENKDSNVLIWKSLEKTLDKLDVYTKNITTSGYIYSSNFIGIGSNLNNINLEDRDTSLLKEGSNLYFTNERVGNIANSSNIKTMNYILLTSNLISKRISSLSTNEIKEGSNLYYTDERYDARLSLKTLDNIYNGTSNKYIKNDIYTDNLLITGTLTVGKIQILGIDFKNNNNNITYINNDITYLKNKVEELNQTIISLLNRIVLLENR